MWAVDHFQQSSETDMVEESLCACALLMCLLMKKNSKSTEYAVGYYRIR